MKVLVQRVFSRIAFSEESYSGNACESYLGFFLGREVEIIDKLIMLVHDRV